MQILKKSLREEAGATAIEYGLIATLVSVVIIGAVSAVSGKLQTTFNSMGTA